MEIKVLDGQSLLDIAIETSGSMEAAFALAEANGVSLTAELTDGQRLDTVEVAHAETARRYRAQGLHPATALTDGQMAAIAQEGIDFMGIEIDFIVS